MRSMKGRIAELKASGGGSVHCVLRFEDQTEAEAVAAYQRKNALEGVDMERGLLVFITKPSGAQLNSSRLLCLLGRPPFLEDENEILDGLSDCDGVAAS